MLALSLITTLSFMDFGVANAITNRVASQATSNDQKDLAHTISGGFFILILIGIIVALLLLSIALLFPWAIFFDHTQQKLAIEVKSTAIWFSILFATSIVSQGLPRIFLGLQKAYIAHLISAIGAAMACLSLWLVARDQAEISALLIAVFGTQLLINFALVPILVKRDLLVFGNFVSTTKIEFRQIYKNAAYFLCLQLGVIVGWGADSLIIATVLGVGAVAIFALVQRLFQIVTQPLAILNAPLWGSYADAHARNDISFIRKTLIRSSVITVFGASLLTVILFNIYPWIVANWTRSTIEIPQALMFWYGVWIVVEASGNAFAMFLNGIGMIRQQLIVVLWFIALVLPLKFIFAFWLNLPGVPLATLLIYLGVNFVFYGVIYLPELKQKIRSYS